MGPIAKAVNHRIDGVKYPADTRPGWNFMAYSLMSFGSWALEDGGNFLDFAWAAAPDIDPARNRSDAEHQKETRRRAPKLARAFNKVLSSGEVKSGYSTVGGGEITTMPAEWWLTDDPMLRYRTFSIDPEHPFSDRLDLPCWIWIESATLRKTTDRLYRERMGWGPLPELQTLPRTEYYDRGDGLIETWHWLADGTQKVTSGKPRSAQSKAGRPSMVPRILKLFADHIRSDSVADRVAWEGAAISREYGGDKPPTPDTCADRIRTFYNQIIRDDEGGIINGGEVLRAMGYPINPDKLLYSPMKAG